MIHFNCVLFYKDSPAMLLLYHWNLTLLCVCVMTELVFFTMLEMSSLSPPVRSKVKVTLFAVTEPGLLIVIDTRTVSGEAVALFTCCI